MSPTIQELADEIRVHKATVSRALSGKPGVGEELRRRIIRLAGDRGFYPNGQARTLATSRTETLALVFCDETSEFLTNPFYSKVVAGVAIEIGPRGFSLAFCSLSAHGTASRSSLPKIMKERRADGFLFVGDQDDILVRYAHNLGYPVVLVDHRYHGKAFDTVAIDNVAGGRRAAEHLLQLGHRRIGFVGGSLESPSFKERLEGYRAAMEAAGLSGSGDLVQVGGGLSGGECMEKLLALPRPPTAVFACNDVNAVKAIRAIREHGLRVPENVSVVGFDDSRRAVESWPLLTTMRVDAEKMGRLAVEALAARIARPDTEPRQVIVDAELVVRRSTAAPPYDSVGNKTGKAVTQNKKEKQSWQPPR